MSGSGADVRVDGDRPFFLVGFMGSGKSTVGGLLATRLGREFVDTDQLVEAREGRTIEAIFREDGEPCFRRAEWKTLQSLAGRGTIVAATGGGLFTIARQRRWVRRRAFSVWLDPPFEVCLARLPGPAGRPLWTSATDPGGLRAMFERRRAAYALADIRVTAVGPPDEVVADLLARLDPDFP